MKYMLATTFALFALSAVTSVLPAHQITTPEQFFGFRPGTDRMAFTYEQLIDYLKAIEGQSDRMSIFPIGTSPMGKPMFVACFSSPANLKNLDRLKEINRKLALDPALAVPERDQLIREGRVFVLATMSMHSGEIAPSQSVPLTAYDWLTTQDEKTLKALDNTVFMIVP